MKITFLGTSHAAQHLSAAAAEKGFQIVGLEDSPSLVFVSEDTPTDDAGVRDLQPIRDLIPMGGVPIVLTSQVPPGFTRSLARNDIYHQAETLRIKDAAERARNPEQIIVGCHDPHAALPLAYLTYLQAFHCPIHLMSYESAEFSKMAINAFLISQVETTNMLSRLAAKCGADWFHVKQALHSDSRIGMNAYLDPGRWQDSKHMLRDYATLFDMEPPWSNLLESWQ